eukprot:m.104797 g.104797  ORF g.104797 m.104797 type:complete len:511 (-) comp8900_c0_seq1:217-1749(-)
MADLKSELISVALLASFRKSDAKEIASSLIDSGVQDFQDASLWVEAAKRRDLRIRGQPLDRLQLLRLKDAFCVRARMPLDPALVRFWNAASQLEDEMFTPNTIITLDTFLLGRSDWGKRLYVRPSYLKLERVVEEIFELQPPRVGIIGNPGIGKSFFGIFLILRAAARGVPVVYQSRELHPTSDVCYVLSRDYCGTLPLTHDLVEEIFTNPKALYVADSIYPTPPPSARTVLVSSPRKDVYDHFCRKRSGINTPLYMPVWKRGELELLRETFFPAVDLDAMNTLFERWGGIPRDVLEKAKSNLGTVGLVSDSLEQAIAICSIDTTWVHGVRAGSDETVEISHRVFHAKVDKQFRLKRYTVASPYVDEKLILKWASVERFRLQSFVAYSHGEGILGGLRGHIFEFLAHAMLSEGGKFPCRQLGVPDDSPSKIRIRSAPIIHKKKRFLACQSSRWPTISQRHAISLLWTRFSAIFRRMLFMCDCFKWLLARVFIPSNTCPCCVCWSTLSRSM